MTARFLRLAALVVFGGGACAAHAANCPPTTLAPVDAPPGATVGTAYSHTFTASNSNASPFTYALTSGLPASSGLALDAGTGTLSGTPTQVGSYLFTVAATDATGCSGGRVYPLSVAQGSQTIVFTSTAPASAQIGGAAYTATAAATSGLPVSLSIDTSASGVCAIAGSSVSFLAAGTCVIDANQGGNANYAAAPQAQQSFAVGKSSQTISFTSTAPAAAVVGGAAYVASATATSGLAVSFSIDATASSVCAIAGNSVTFQAAGTCVIDADQAGDATYNAAPQVQQSFAVGKSSQTISFTSTAPAAAVVGGAAYVASATATSGLAVSFIVDATASSVCAIAGNSVTFQAAGTCVIDANQAGDANYTAAPQVQQSFAVGKGSQAVGFTSTAPSSATVNGTAYTVSATATSGLPVSFTIDAAASSICAIAGNSVTFQAAGTCVIDANQAGDANYTAAPQVQQSFAVGKGSQAIGFTSTAPSSATVNGTAYTVSATATSGLPVSFTIDAAASSICAIAGNSVTFQAAGTCVIDANQAGNLNYNAAPQVQQSFVVGKASQTISFTSTAPSSASVNGAAYTVSATSTSGLPVSFTIDAASTSICSIGGSSVSFQAVGTCVIDANQAGDANYNAAPQAQQSFVVGKGSQTTSFTSSAPAASVGGATYAVTATATSGLPVSFTIDAVSSGVCSIAGTTVSFQAAGTCVIDSNQAGNANWNAATQVQQSITVAKGNQAISFTSAAPSGAAVSGPAYSASATATSGLAVALSIDPSAAGVCSIAGTIVSFQHVGTCVVDANQPGNANWNAAPQAQQTFTVARGLQSISFTSTAPSDATNQGATYTVSATSTSGLPVSFSTASSACMVSGSTVSFIGAGTCTVNADQAGDADWNAASTVQQSFAVAKADQSISFTSTAPATANAGGATYAVTATATSGLAVTLSIDPSAAAVCTISSGTVSFVAGGTCVIDADQAGDANFNAAPQVQQSFAVSACISPNLGEVVNGAMPGSSSVCVANASGGPMEFTYLPINNSTSSDITLNVVGTNIQAVTGPPSPRPGDSPLAPLASPDASLVDVHDTIDTSAFPNGEIRQSARIVTPSALPGGPLTVGQMFDVNVNFACSGTADLRKARVEAITTPQHAGQQVLYAVQEVVEQPAGSGIWVPAVAGGYTTSDFQNIVDSVVQSPPGSTPAGPSGSGNSNALLKTGGLDILTTNFGAPTDLDANGGVVIFFTRAINELVPPASSTVVQGQFAAKDIFSNDPVSGCSNSNQGEILYMMVPDPTGVVNSNVRTWSFAFGSASITILHHLQHMDNALRRAYITGASFFEDRWLDEALSWTMQELVFYSASVGLAPKQNIQLSTLTTGPSASTRVNAFNSFENTMFGATRSYFYQLNSTNGNKRFGPFRTTSMPLATGHDVIAQNFSGTFLFLRYAMDRKNSGDAGILNALVNSNLQGRANLQNALGVTLDDWGRDFLVAMYADDAVTGANAIYAAPSWNYRSVFGGLGGFPLTVDTLTNATPVNYVLGTGGGTRYVRFGVADGQTATLTTTLTSDGSAPPSTVGMALVRTK